MAFIVEFRENKGQFRSTFLKDLLQGYHYPYALWVSSLQMTAETMNGVICISLNRNSLLSGMSYKNSPDESRVEFEENL